PSTPTLRTRTSTPRPSGMSSTDGFGTSSRWIEPALPGVTAIAFTQRLSRLSALRYSRRVGQALAEEKLLESLRAGDEAAFRELVREYQPSLVRVARIYVSSQAAAEEVAQETWLGVLNGLRSEEHTSELQSLAY